MLIKFTFNGEILNNKNQKIIISGIEYKKIEKNEYIELISKNLVYNINDEIFDVDVNLVEDTNEDILNGIKTYEIYDFIKKNILIKKDVFVYEKKFIKENDILLKFDFSNIVIPIKENYSDLEIFDKPRNINYNYNDYEKELRNGIYFIDNKNFSLQDVSGNEMRCFYNTLGLNPQKVYENLILFVNDPIARFMIGNSIVNIRSSYLNFEKIFQNEYSVSAYNTFIYNFIYKGDIMIEITNTEGLSYNEYIKIIVDGKSTYFMLVDVIAYLYNIGIKIYNKNLKIVHEYIPLDSNKIAYIYNDSDHYKLFLPHVYLKDHIDNISNLNENEKYNYIKNIANEKKINIIIKLYFDINILITIIYKNISSTFLFKNENKNYIIIFISWLINNYYTYSESLIKKENLLLNKLNKYLIEFKEIFLKLNIDFYNENNNRKYLDNTFDKQLFLFLYKNKNSKSLPNNILKINLYENLF